MVAPAGRTGVVARTRRRAALIPLAFASLGALVPGSGCGRGDEGPWYGSTERGGRDPATLVINGGGEPEYLDPGKSTDTASSSRIYQMFEGLTAYGPGDLRPVQGVATHYEKSDDNRFFRFHLRPEARWSDGRPVTAHDFEYAWKRVLRPATASKSAVNLHVLRNGEAFNLGKITDDRAVGVRATSDLVLEVELEQPTPYFPELACYSAFLPVRRDVVEPFEARGEGDLWFRPENIVVNGPYTLESWRFRDEMTLRQNPFYWDRERLKIRRVVVTNVEGEHATMNLYKSGELDALGTESSLPAEYTGRLSGRKDLRRFPVLGTYWYELNVKKPPVDDPRVRRALNHAIDKRLITERVVPGTLPATHYVPDYTGSGYREQAEEDQRRGEDPFAGPDFAFDPARGRELLAEAGYPVVEEGGEHVARGFPQLEILYNTSEGHRSIAVAIQDMWRRHLGIRAALRNEEWGVLLKDVSGGHFQIFRYGWVGDYNHPHTWLATFLSTNLENRTGWADPGYDELLKAAAAAGDPGEGIRLYRKAEARALAGMAKIPLYFFTQPTLVKPWVKGFIGNPRNIQLVKWLWIDPGWRGDPAWEGSPGEVAAPPIPLPPPGRIMPGEEWARP